MADRNEPQKTSSELLLDEAIRTAVLIEEVAVTHSSWVRERLLDIMADIVALIARIDPTQPVRLIFREERLEKLIGEAKELISSVFVAARKRTEQVLTAVSETSQLSLSEAIAGLLAIKGLSGLLKRPEHRQQVRGTDVMGSTLDLWLARQSGDVQFRLERALRQAMVSSDLTAPTLDVLVSAVRGPDMGPGGVFKAPIRNIEHLVQTAVHAVSNRIRLETLKSHPELFKGFQHISVLDSKTTDLCRSRDGLRFLLDGSPVGHRQSFRVPPLHFRCRSHLAPIMLEHANLPGRIRKRTVPSSYTGKSAPDVTDLEAWLREQESDVEQAKLIKTWRKALDDLMPKD